MLAMNYRGPYRVRLDKDKPEPEIQHPEDAIVRVLRSCICGSDLHIYHGLVPDTRVGSTFGHEFIGEIVEVGSEVTNVKVIFLLTGHPSGIRMIAVESIVF